jgi:cytoskeletal protein CcmA (bactofilin family)
MFAKQPVKTNADRGPAPALGPSDAPPARKSLKVATVIADDLTVEGDINGDGELHVDGTVRGDIRVGRLTLGETGQIEGNVFAENIEVRGRIVGSVSAKFVRLFATAHIDGDVTQEQLAMEPGAFFQGRVQKLQRPSAVAQPGPVAAPLIATPLPNERAPVSLKLGEVGPIRPRHG